MQALIKVAYRMLQVRWFFTRPVTLGVRVLLVKDGDVLLVWHTYQAGWFLPGGGVKRGETLEQAARREASEECGATIGAMQLLGIYSNFADYKSDHILLYLSKDFTLSGNSDAEIESWGLFALNQLPPDVSPGSQRRIQEYIQGAFAANRCGAGSW